MEKSIFDTFIDNNVSSDKIKILLKNIHKSLKSLEEVWIHRELSLTLEYLSKISILFTTHGVKMFEKNPPGIDIITGCFLFSQPIDAKKIRCPRGFTNEHKAEFKKNVDNLVKAWSLIGKYFPYEKCASTILKNDENRIKLEAKLKSVINLENTTI